LRSPYGIAVDSSGDILIADIANYVVREVSASTGDISTVAGDGTRGFTGVGGPATSAELYEPSDVVFGTGGNFYIDDLGTGRVSEVSASTGDISTIATGASAYQFAIDSTGDIYAGAGVIDPSDPLAANYAALAAPTGGYSGPDGVALDSSGNVFVADAGKSRIYEISPLGTAPTGSLVSDPQRVGGGGEIARGTCTCKSGDPIDNATGDFTESATDAALPTYGPSLSFTRTYDATSAQAESATSTPGPLGYGWTDNWSTSLALNSDYGTTVSGDVTFIQANGSEALFVPPVSSACQAPYTGPGTSGTYCKLPRVLGSLTYNSGSSTYTLVEHPEPIPTGRPSPWPTAHRLRVRDIARRERGRARR
jgi:hypothetical protein